MADADHLPHFRHAGGRYLHRMVVQAVLVEVVEE
jgi:hypothetical protein